MLSLQADQPAVTPALRPQKASDEPGGGAGI